MRLEKVAKRYGIRRPWVIRDVSLEIPPGRLVRFEGKNGSGKSTILRVIAGVSQPGRGSVTGRPVTGYVPERFPPALPFPARAYLSRIGRVHGLGGAELDARIDACLDRLGGGELAEVPLRHMSKGMCQKVAVAQALLPGTGLLVLDEAWTGLDVEAKAALDEAVAERLAGGGSVVYVDHEPGRLAHLDADRWRLDGSRGVRRRAARPAGRRRDRPGASGRQGTGRQPGRPVMALVWYELALLLRSHRWIPPAVLFVLSVIGLGGATLPHGARLSQGLAWSALMLVPVGAWLTRSMLTAEPAAARACVAAAGGPRRTQLAALAAAAVVGAALGLLGVIWELATLGVPRSDVTNSVETGHLLSSLGGGLTAALICLLVGSAVAALFNPPLVRRPGTAMLCTTAAVVLALAWNGSPANAAVRSVGYGAVERTWPAGVAFMTALALAAAAWAISAQVASRRDV